MRGEIRKACCHSYSRSLEMFEKNEIGKFLTSQVYKVKRLKGIILIGEPNNDVANPLVADDLQIPVCLLVMCQLEK